MNRCDVCGAQLEGHGGVCALCMLAGQRFAVRWLHSLVVDCGYRARAAREIVDLPPAAVEVAYTSADAGVPLRTGAQA
jgi:hypothetical protein